VIKAPRSTISENRDGILQQLENSEQAAAELVAGMSGAQVNWQPKGVASWSVWQCLDHLARTNRVYCQSILAAVARSSRSGKLNEAPTGRITPGWFGRWFIAKMGPAAGTKYKAPSKVTPEVGGKGDAQAVLRDFVESHAEARRILESWERLDFNRVRFKNPFIPGLRFTVGTGLMIINAHDRRHLWQAERVKEAEGYPAA
jgi:DinB superfamily